MKITGTSGRRNLRRRLDMLEKQIIDEPILLKMPDDSIEILEARRGYMFDLFSRACDGDRTPEMELIAQSVGSIEPDGAHMVDLVRVFLNGPNLDTK
jgi:hypothetical protein